MRGRAMSIPYTTRCALQLLRESSDERAQDAYALAVQALVSGAEHDVERAAAAMHGVRDLRLASPSSIPAQCHADAFHTLHEAAHSALSTCGMRLPNEVLSETRARETTRSLFHLLVAVVLVLLCVLLHAWLQRCRPAHMCGVCGV